MRRGGRKRGARDSEGDGGRPTRGLGLAREGAACGHGARMPSRCGRCCVRRDGLAWSGRCVNGRWQGGGKQGGCRRQGTGGSGWRRQGGWRRFGGRQWEVSLSSRSTSTVPRFNPGYFPPQFFPWFNLGHFLPATSFGSSGKSMAPPPAFMEQMVHDRARWANGIADAGVVRAIARAVAGTCLPWHADWSNWRTHTCGAGLADMRRLGCKYCRQETLLRCDLCRYPVCMRHSRPFGYRDGRPISVICRDCDEDDACGQPDGCCYTTSPRADHRTGERSCQVANSKGSSAGASWS